MHPFQNVSFSTIEEMLEVLPPEEKKLVEQLRAVVFACIPDATERLSYNVPFYYRHTRICFIWPGSVPWGGIREGVMLGFCKGSRLTDAGYLEKGSRKTVFTKTFYTTKEIDREAISQLLYEAVLVDEVDNRAKRQKKARKH
jgi:hypothetical protein